jgi:hypothetical protein
VQIHTWAENGNAGKDADDIADSVYSSIYPTPNHVLSLTGFQMVGTTLGNDLAQELTAQGGRVFITRILTFNHNIFHQ